ncbi:PID-CTERM protein-sorting domain-containing protein [Thermoflexibacter ruber]|uniref:XrtJ-associated TM-motif-TM protein n=1 Tax=Thermoflexibacter ruber TaxID=1003 RepID=A0A1I2K4H0_9BACT|nr:hypothetical protein [Thermoflexibacter ruber]SFF61238.1 hypothetical protein SAMN04488541_10825 [Thermoflexibacter ruber]
MKRIIVASFLMFVSFYLQAQGLDPVPPPSSEIPIDGGLGILLVAGALYGAKVINDRNKKHIK